MAALKNLNRCANGKRGWNKNLCTWPVSPSAGIRWDALRQWDIYSLCWSLSAITRCCLARSKVAGAVLVKRKWPVITSGTPSLKPLKFSAFCGKHDFRLYFWPIERANRTSGFSKWTFRSECLVKQVVCFVCSSGTPTLFFVHRRLPWRRQGLLCYRPYLRAWRLNLSLPNSAFLFLLKFHTYRFTECQSAPQSTGWNGYFVRNKHASCYVFISPAPFIVPTFRFMVNNLQWLSQLFFSALCSTQ